MKKEVIICIIVITFMIIGNIITQNHTKQCVEELSGQLSDLRGGISIKNKSEEDELKLNKKSDEIRKKWDDMQESLSFYVEHDELEKVETQLTLLKRRNGNKII